VRAVALIGVCAGLVVGIEAHHLQLAVLYLAPALVLWGLLTANRYPGERILERVRRSGSREVLEHAVPAARRPRPARRTMPRGGVLVASSLAGRAPPALAAP
jgi:hypothetical protein